MGNDEMPFIIGMFSIIVVALLIGLTMFLNYRKRVLVGQEIMAAIEKGIDVPFPSQAPSLNYRSRGILWTSMGLAAGLVLLALSGEIGVASLGLIPTAYGVASLLIAWSSDRATDKS